MKRSVPLPGRIGMVALGWMILVIGLMAGGEENRYLWMQREGVIEPIWERIPSPPGFARIETEPGSFAHWLRHLPLKPAGTPVFLYNGEKKADQTVHHAVIDIDTGARNLQQCADAVIRLRAEYLYSRKRFGEIVFRFTSGQAVPFSRWVGGERPVVNGNRVSWKRTSGRDRSHACLQNYLETLFVYAGSHSLARELEPRFQEEIEIGDVFIHGGFPGHAVLVVDMARAAGSGEKIFLLAQGYMPAQDMHILVNPGEPALSPWYRLPAGETLITPEWTFRRNDLRHFPRPAPSAEP